MKLLFIMLITFCSLNADYLFNYRGVSFCAKSYSFNDYQYFLNVTRSSDNSILLLRTDDIRYIETGYKYELGVCKKDEILSFLGLEFEDYNFLIALTALFLGFITLFFMLLVTLEVTKK